jgi:hypothetical protein
MKRSGQPPAVKYEGTHRKTPGRYAISRNVAVGTKKGGSVAPGTGI